MTQWLDFSGCLSHFEGVVPDMTHIHQPKRLVYIFLFLFRFDVETKRLYVVWW